MLSALNRCLIGDEDSCDSNKTPCSPKKILFKYCLYFSSEESDCSYTKHSKAVIEKVRDKSDDNFQMCHQGSTKLSSVQI